MKLHIIIHEDFEAPGAIINWAHKNNCEVAYTRFYLGESLPETPNEFDYLIIMGGPQAPDTTTDECPHFDARKEIQFIKEAIDNNKYVLGVCLGAQLIGEALGAKFDHSPHREIGVFPVSLTEEGKNDPIINTFGDPFNVGHWHGDMPGLTDDAEVLAYSEGCPRQIVRYSKKVYGFQCHFEFTQDSIEGMIQNCGHELEEYKDLPYIETAEELRAHDYSPINTLLFNFLDYMKGHFDNGQK